MNQVKQLFYDSPESEKWINRIEPVFLKRDHRRVLNVQPEMTFAVLGHVIYPCLMINWKVMSN